MTLEERAALAAEKKSQGLCNCCQAVVAALADQTPLTAEQLHTAASGFAVGMGNMEASCGALVGAVLAAGLHLRDQGAVPYARRLSESFRSRCGAITCKELKGRDTGAVLCSCEDCVKNAVLAYGQVMGLE